jgi:hypothetical protein
MQAHYLAESAVNHALWRLLNDPGFTPESDKYYMHSLGDGRYGYKVRMPTQTTFATVATVGAMGNIATQQSYVQYIIPSNVFTVYGNSTHQNAISRRLIGAQWTDPFNIPTGGAPMIHWAELEGCPTRKELVGGVIDSNDDIQMTVWDGTAWGNQLAFTNNADRNYKSFDIAYESQSGDALVVGRYDATTTVRYNIWDGTAWVHVTAQPAFNLASGALSLVTMASCPGNDDILIATVNWNNDLQLFRWNGSAFTDLGTIASSTQTDEYGVVQIVYEQQSGDALVIWSSEGEMRYRVWNGSTLGPENIISLFPDDVKVLRAAADPASDTIVLAAIDKFYDITVAVWDGDAWTDSREVETSGADLNVQCFDVAWEASGEDALVVWAPWNKNYVRSLAWRKGTMLADSSVEQGPDFQDLSLLVRLLPISGTEKIVLLGENWNLQELRYSLWDGDRLKGDPAILLESDIPVNFKIAFDLAEADVPRTGGTGTGVGVNLAPVVDAGPDQTLIFPTMETSLDGTVTDDGLPNPPAAVTTTWSMVSGPGTVVFGDASQVDTKIKVSDPGTYVFRLTADDSELGAFDEVTIIVEAPAMTILLVVGNATTLSSKDSGRKALMESWGYTVTLIDDGDSQANFDAAAAAASVVYVSGTIGDGTLLDKLTGSPTPIVNEFPGKLDNFGFCSGTGQYFSADTFAKSDPAHYITSPFGGNSITVLTTFLLMPVPSGTLAPDLQVPAGFTATERAVVTLNTGAQRWDGNPAPARRAHLPFAAAETTQLTADGKTVLQRAIEWAAGGSGSSQLLFVVPDASGPSTQDNDRKALMEGWGWTVTFISASATQAEFDAAVAINKVAYVMEQITPDDLNTKLRDAAIGVVNEQSFLVDEFGFSGNREWPTPTTTLDLTDNTHYITSPFGIGDLIIASSAAEVISMGGSKASGLQELGMFPQVGQPGLGAIEIGGGLYGGGVAAGRRVQLPWGRIGFDINSLTDDGRTIMKRAIEWAASGGGGGGSDTDPPSPDPMTWANPPTADGPTSIAMTATTASDPSGVQYYFECTAGGGDDSGWQTSATYVDSGLSPETQYTYRVKARDRSANYNETGWSPGVSATTLSNVIYVQDIAMGFRTALGNKYYGQATVWVRSVEGANISGAIVSGDWSGAVSGTSMANTGSDGKVMLESPVKKNGGTFTFTVTNVTTLGYIYNSSLNGETSDSITAP